MKWRPWLAAPIALALGGCDFAPRYAPPSVAMPSKFKDETAGGGTLPASGEWWLSFHDRTLNDLQAQVDAANPDLAAAVAANDAAVARANAALSAAYPQVDADPHFLANKQSANRPLRSANQPTYYGDNLIGAQTAYEIDIWGRVRDLVASANATAEASADALADARLELHAELARDYVNLRGFDDQAKLLSDTIAIYRSALKLTQDRLAANIASPVDVDRAQAQLSSAEAQLSDLMLNRATLENSIAALVGKAAASFSVAAIFEPASACRRPPRAVPADVLRRRPDVAQTERQTAAASEADRRVARQFLSQVHVPRARRNAGHQFQTVQCGSTCSGASGLRSTFPLFDAGLRQAELADRQGPIHRGGGELSGHRVARHEGGPGRAVVACAGWREEYNADDDGGDGGAQGGRPVLDPLSRRGVVLSRRGDGAKRGAGCGTSGDRAAHPPIGGRYRPDAGARRRLDRAARTACEAHVAPYLAE